MRCFRLWLCILVASAAALSSCGNRGGSDKGGEPPHNPDPAKTPGDGTPSSSTGVGLMLIQNTLPKSTVCRAATSVAPLHDLGTKFVLDGQLGDWSEAQPFVTDPAQDGVTNADIRLVNFARQPGGFAAAVTLSGAAELNRFPIHLEWSGLVIREGRLVQVLAREYRLDGLRISTYRDGAWIALSDEDAGFAVHGSVVEFSFAQRELEGVLFYPTWGLRAYTQTNDGIQRDTTAAGYSQSLLNPDKPQLHVSLCSGYRNGDEQFVFQEVRQLRSVADGIDRKSVV